MRTSQTMIPTLREVPAEALIISHQLMLRAGLVRKLGNGLFAYLPLGLRVFRKVEQIIRDEMNRIGALECKPPVVVPGELWRESGRWDTMGESMLRAKNRLNQDLVISPTAEEAFTALMRDELSSYKQLPISLYQINTKYRDEIRPRYGVMRGREFTMKDAYSFHADEKSLDATYHDFAKAYRRIFKRLGLSVIPVRADSGAMGGTGSEEFMVESEVGDDTLILCPNCSYAANTEKASCAPDLPLNAEGSVQKPAQSKISFIDTPNIKTIDELSGFLKTNAQSFIKTLVYRLENCKSDFVAVCIRGDLDVNEAKLAALMKASGAELASDTDAERITGAPLGFAGPVGLSGISILADNSVMDMHDAVTGGLKKDLHLAHVEPNRDFKPDIIGDVRTARSGDKCPLCKAEVYSKKGNELGHIFKLGNKYAKSMELSYLDETGVLQIPIMGCYGIGLDRSIASIIEEHHDADGIIWPMTSTPYQAVIIPIKYETAMKDSADALYEQLKDAGIEVLLDDRTERPGVKFKDMDLLGIPLRIVVSDKNLPKLELKLRNAEKPELLSAAEALEKTIHLVKTALTELNDCSKISI